MHIQKPFLAGLLFLVNSLLACDSTEIGDSKDVNQDKIYMDYNLSYTEDDEQVLLSFQYRFAGSAGTTLVLNNNSGVELDGEKLKVDSSESVGAFYETHKHFNTFIGQHQILFTDDNGKPFENSFEFAPFTLTNLPITAEPDKDLIVSFNTIALGTMDFIEINSLDTDSSFRYQQSGPASSITIPASELMRQKGKTLTLEPVLFRTIPLSQTTSEGGSFKLFYKLKPVKIKLHS